MSHPSFDPSLTLREQIVAAIQVGFPGDTRVEANDDHTLVFVAGRLDPIRVTKAGKVVVPRSWPDWRDVRLGIGADVWAIKASNRDGPRNRGYRRRRWWRLGR